MHGVHNTHGDTWVVRELKQDKVSVDCPEQAEVHFGRSSFRKKFISEEVLPESQCGFWQGRSTSDIIFTLRQVQVKAAEQHQPLYIVFVDLAKAFDSVDRTTVWKILEIYGCPEKLVNIIRQFHCEMKVQVSVGGEPSDAFEAKHGMKQGCVLAPTRFVSENCSMLMIQSLLQTTQLICSKLWIVSSSAAVMFEDQHFQDRVAPPASSNVR